MDELPVEAEVEEPTTRRIEDSTPFHAGTNWIMAVLALAAAVGIVWWFKLPLEIDFASPAFNPAVFVPVLLVLVALFQVVKAVRGRMVGQRFGATIFEMEGQYVVMGESLRGRLVTARDLAAASGFLVRLRCIDNVRYASSAGGVQDKTRDVIRHQAEHTVEVVDSGSRGVPVEFAIPSERHIRKDSSERPGPIRWTLEIEATVEGARYEALFGVPVALPADE